MSWTKGALVKQALADCGVAEGEFDTDVDILSRGLARMDAMMAVWASKGIQVGYVLSSLPENADANSDSGLPLELNEAVLANLAVRLAPSIGKTVSQVTAAIAKQSYDQLLATAVRQNTQQMQVPGSMPQGGRWSRFVYPPVVDPLPTTDGGDLNLGA